ncbi:Small heat shock protein C4 [Psilocybe cubensis]|uniref:Small heat shock protein C4 n=2 Tax=Psilocybe cubensis TaxID=181762 RepID=A0ACB8GFG5_PSICU|nr:Small heat shock protein C4 [Psilocybe cubensis]KAH9474430.1 Small heat shock protein C4 [Psilocybe cubensis]
MSNVFFYEPYYDFDRLFEEAFARHAHGGPRHNQLQRRNAAGDGAVRSLKPRMDLHEDAEKNLVTATFEFPGVSKENVSIDVHNNRLSVSAELKQASEFEEHGYAVRERQYGKFSRTLQLPAGVKDSEIKANMENGVLTITFPKTVAVDQVGPKKITIS